MISLTTGVICLTKMIVRSTVAHLKIALLSNENSHPNCGCTLRTTCNLSYIANLFNFIPMLFFQNYHCYSSVANMLLGRLLEQYPIDVIPTDAFF